MSGVTFRRAGREAGETREEVREPGPPAVVEWARRELGFEPDERQRELLERRVKRGILKCTRQWGKSTVAAVMAVHRALYPFKSPQNGQFRSPSGSASAQRTVTAPLRADAKTLVVVACPTEKQSAELVWKARDFAMKAGVKLRGDGSNRISLQFPNGSRIIGIPGREATLRGYSAVSLLIIDEASRVEDAVYKALRPMLAVGDGDLWLLSTPFGKRGFFYENWTAGGEEWVRVQVAATECARISKDFLAEERRQLGDAWFRQEYMGEFIDNEQQMFQRELLMDALEDGNGLGF